MLDPAQIAFKASTQDHLDIEDIRDDVVILKDGGACLVVNSTAINFGLLSEREQEAAIGAYAQLLNSLSFPLQIIIRSQRKDVTAYLKLLEEAENRTVRPQTKNQIAQYRHFITETVQKNNVLDKKFFLVIPMSALEIGLTSTLAKALTRSKKLPFDKAYILEKAKVNLWPKRDHLLRQLNRLGLRGRQLSTPELIKLFFDIYNPENYGQQIAPGNDYETAMLTSSQALPTTPVPTTPPVIDTSPVKTPISKPTPISGEINLQDQITQLVKETK